MTSSTPSERGRVHWPVLVLLALLVVPVMYVVIGVGWYVWAAGPGYYAEAERVERMASEIPGVEVLEVKGHDDITYEDLGRDGAETPR